MTNKELPKDPIIRQLISQAKQSQMSRRAVLAGMGGAAAIGALAACAPGTGTEPAEDLSDVDKSVTWGQWTFYIDEDENGGRPTLERFEEKFGIDVTYLEDIDDNDSFYGKIKDQLELGTDTGYDLFTPTEWMASKLIRAGYIQELDVNNIPNKANLLDTLQNVDFDPGRKKSMPWQNGFACLAYNVEAVGREIRTVEDLWTNDLRGKVSVLSEMRDTMGLIMLQQGVDISANWGDTEYENAIEYLRQKISDGYVRSMLGNSYTEDLTSGDLLACFCWSGDIMMLNAEEGYEKYKVVQPEAGQTLWGDTLVVPNGAKHKKNAEILMNYYYEPEVAAEVAAWVNYISPVEGAKEAAIAIDPELAENQLIFPNEETLSNSYIYRSLTDEEDFRYLNMFKELSL